MNPAAFTFTGLHGTRRERITVEGCDSYESALLWALARLNPVLWCRLPDGEILRVEVWRTDL